MRGVALVGLLLAAAGCNPVLEPILVEEPKAGAAERVKAPNPGTDWPKFLGPNGDGTTSETGINTNWRAKPLKKLWECSLGVGYAPPSVVGGKLYHFDREGDQARLICRNAETGELIWKFEYPTSYEDYYGYDPGPRACPVIDGNRVYIHGVEGMLHCVSVQDGKLIWKFDTKEKYHFHQNFFGVGSVPLVDGDTLIVPVGGSPEGFRPSDFREVKPNGKAIVGFDKLTGQVKYAFGDELASYSSPILASIKGKKVGLYFARGGLMLFDPQAGKQLDHFAWRARSEESVNAANPLVVEDKILITECYEKGSALLRLQGEKLAPVWTDAKKDRGEEAMLAHWCTPIYHEGHFYGSSGRHANEADLRCVNLLSGELTWREPRTTRCTLIKIDGHLLSLAESGELRLIKPNPDKYEEVARFEVPELSYPAWAPPVVSRGLLYLRGKDDSRRDGHKLVCYDFRK